MTAIEHIFLQKERLGIETKSFTICLKEFLHSGERRETDHYYDRADRHRTPGNTFLIKNEINRRAPQSPAHSLGPPVTLSFSLNL